MLKIVFAIGTIFCLAQFVSTSPASPRWKRSTEDSDESSLEKGLNDLFGILIMAKLMTCETVASAGNTHCDNIFIPDNQTLDTRNHVVTNSLADLWQDLRYVERVQSIYEKTVEKLLLVKDADAVNQWYEGLDKALTEDLLVGPRYKELRSKYDSLIVLDADHLAKAKSMSSDDFEKKNDKNRRMVEVEVNHLFSSRLNASKAADGDDDGATKEKKLKFFILAKAIVELSNSDDDKYAKLQKIYNESIVEVAAKIGSIETNEKKAVKALYKKLKYKIKADPILEKELQAKKDELSKKLKERKSSK